ncbi:hypothetical protein PL11_001835 [Lentilactobacillus curieae]|uniref:Peptidase M10 metallopeptidase domain-containing protein n=1 Tax=Lentilactobacillus curieae TaxID=1138822 RepID=A0A1S6QGK2_9LACO|nr:matrixin family metalloprotease [Lentilactobacillus curieae]AQW20744.1 hypothetical protein PL11_001835 [Lentilactobacillus curieae]
MKTRLKIKSTVVAGLLVVFGTSAIGVSHPAKAAGVTPPQSLLNKSQNYYKDNYQTLAKKYRISYSLQSGIAKNRTVKIYLGTKNKDLRDSLYFAVQYWNDKLGRQVFQYGTKGSHTLTFNTVNNATGSNDGADAWWDPGEKRVVVNLKMYKNSLAQLSKQIIDNSQQSGVSGADLTAERQDIAVNGLDKTSRTLYYGATLTHELGHVLGLNHSPNKNDTMYFESDSPQVHYYQSLKNATNAGYNPLTNTDVLRAQLALKVFGAFK